MASKGVKSAVLPSDSFSAKCKQHPDQVVKLYCKIHKVTCCLKCMYHNHENCDYTTIKEALLDFYQDEGELRLRETVTVLESEYTDRVKNCEDNKKVAECIYSKVNTDLNAYRDEVISYVNRILDHDKTKATTLDRQNRSRLEKQTKDLENIGKELAACKKMLKASDDRLKLFLASNELERKSDEIRKVLSEIKHRDVLTTFVFQPDKELENMMKESKTLGGVCTTDYAHSLNTLESGSDVVGEVSVASCATSAEKATRVKFPGGGPGPLKSVLEDMGFVEAVK